MTDNFPSPERMAYERIITLRRTLHMHPEIGFELPETLSLIKKELTDIGIDEAAVRPVGKSSLYTYIDMLPSVSPDKSRPYTVALRADTDALPVLEEPGREYGSKIPGAMHACGHDAHTAMLLGAARWLYNNRSLLKCRVKLLFQANEEGYDTGAKYVVSDGFTDDVDIIAGLHVGNELPTGCIGVCPGAAMAGSHNVTVDFIGKSAHAAEPSLGADSIAAAVSAYEQIYLLNSRLFCPDEKRIVSVGVLRGGEAPNIICPNTHMELTVRTFDAALDSRLIAAIEDACKSASNPFGVRCETDSSHYTYPVINDAGLCRIVEECAFRLAGRENFTHIPAQMGSEDFSFYQARVPGVFFRLGTGGEKGFRYGEPHTSHFDLDESALALGSAMLCAFVLESTRSMADL